MVEPTIIYSGPLVTVKEARERKELFYFTGKPCLRGHVDQRYTAITTCRACKAEDHVRYNKKHTQRSKLLARGRSRTFHEQTAKELENLIELAKLGDFSQEFSRTKSSKFRRYGILPSVFIQMFVEQDGKCKICKIPCKPVGNDNACMNIDHCHKTGAIRGLLCQSCNKGLGLLKDSKRILNAALEYLDTEPTVFGRKQIPDYRRRDDFKKSNPRSLKNLTIPS